MAHIPEFQSLKKEAEELTVFQTPQTKIIGLVGASGQGKSSLINSLLNCVEISPTNAGSRACTSIVTEFRQPKQNQNAPILIEIERFSNDGITEIVEQAVIDYRRFAYINKEQSEATESNGDTKATEATKVTEATEDEDDEEFAALKKDAELGWSILEAAFGDREDFSEEFIKGESIFATKQITQILLKWIEESVWPATQGITLIETANNAEECSDKTSNIMESRLWPFIRIIRVYLRAPILDAGIVFADLPGLQDTNFARVKATERYLFSVITSSSFRTYLVS
jgi:energy-coupling factor transporter ATP-binding protein EcfA2